MKIKSEGTTTANLVVQVEDNDGKNILLRIEFHQKKLPDFINFILKQIFLYTSDRNISFLLAIRTVRGRKITTYCLVKSYHKFL